MQGEILYHLACATLGEIFNPGMLNPTDTVASWSWVVLVAIPPKFPQFVCLNKYFTVPVKSEKLLCEEFLAKCVCILDLFSLPPTALKVSVTGPPCRYSHPCQADLQLTAQLTKLQALGVAVSTRCTYQPGVKQYLDFCAEYKISPLPASETTLRYFCAHLSALTSYPTIKVYLAGIRLLHIADPTKEAPLLHYLCTAIRRSQSTPPKKRQPITVSLLKIMEKELFRSNPPFKRQVSLLGSFHLGLLWLSEGE